MPTSFSPDWNPEQDALTQDQRAAYDTQRERCPVSFSDYFQWSLFKHADVSLALLDHQRFSNQVSNYISVPNGMDEPEHTPYRRLIEPYFGAEQMAIFKPVCQAIAAELVDGLLVDAKAGVDIISKLGEPFAARIQCAFMGWPQTLEPVLLDWLKRNNQAARVRDRALLKTYASEFETLINEQLELQRSQDPSCNVTARLAQEKVHGRPLNNAEIASILRNWTVGEVGTIAASISIIVEFLAKHPQLQEQLRLEPEKLWYANDEILRLHNPLVDNRRRTTCPVHLGGRDIPAEARVTLNWVAANRDPEVFENADQFQWGRDESLNLLYGKGVHICPGAPLAKMELVVVIRALLQATQSIRLNGAPVLASYPMSGYQSLSVILH